MPDPGDHDAPISPFTMAGIRSREVAKLQLERPAPGVVVGIASAP